MQSMYTVECAGSGVVQWTGEYSSSDECFEAFRAEAGLDWVDGSYISSFPGLRPQDPDGWPVAYVIWRGDDVENTIQYVFLAPIKDAE